MVNERHTKAEVLKWNKFLLFYNSMYKSFLILFASLISLKAMTQTNLDTALNLLRKFDLISAREQDLVKKQIIKLEEYRKEKGYNTNEDKVNYELNYETLSLLVQAKEFSTSGRSDAFSFTPAPRKTREQSDEAIYNEIKRFAENLQRSGLTSSLTITEINELNKKYKISWELEAANYAFQKTNEEYFLQPEHFKKFVSRLSESGIIDENSFIELEKKSKAGELKRYIEIYPYLKNFVLLETDKMPGNKEEFLKELYAKTSKVFPGLEFDSISYKDVIDKKESFDDFISHNLKVTLQTKNGKYSFSSYYYFEDPKKNNTSEDEEFIAETKVPEEYYQVFNKMLIDVLSPYRLHQVNIDEHTFGIIALTETQTKNVDWTYDGALRNYLNISYEKYGQTLTNKKINEAIRIYDSIGLFSHLTQNEKDSCIKRVGENEINYYTDILKAFDNVVFDIDAEYGVDDAQYKRITENLAAYSRGYFNPVNIIDGYTYKTKNFKYGFTLNDKQYSTKLNQKDDWLDMNFWELIQTALKEQGKKGNFYYIYPSDGITAIYLTNEQYTLLKEKRLLEFSDEDIHD